ncbi:hypothetical protein ACYJW8_16125, partial [Frateuria aurantia]
SATAVPVLSAAPVSLLWQVPTLVGTGVSVCIESTAPTQVGHHITVRHKQKRRGSSIPAVSFYAIKERSVRRRRALGSFFVFVRCLGISGLAG